MKYEYASLTSLEEYKNLFSPEVLRNLNRLYSDRVNKLTGQVFIATPKTVRLSPFGSTLIKIPGPPIVKITSVNVEYSDGSSALLDISNYEAKENNLIRFKNTSTEGVDVVEVSYIAGNIEGKKEFGVTLQTAIDKLAVSAKVADASGLEPRDVLVFGNTDIIINKVDYSLNTIYFDYLGNINTIPLGATTTCYGQVPLQIEEAVKLFIKHHKKLQGFSGRITSEKIGKSYSYETTGLEHTITGIAEIDSILLLFINDDVDILFL